jgi:CRP-like cAMP-binding protein
MRLQMLLWHIAARWGRVTAQGVKVPLRLTHTLLAELAAARRPTVTTALSELARRKLVVTQSDGWLLCGQPPGELMELTPSPAPLLAERQRAAAC